MCSATRPSTSPGHQTDSQADPAHPEKDSGSKKNQSLIVYTYELEDNPLEQKYLQV